MTNYRGRNTAAKETSISQAKELNIIFSCFEVPPLQSSATPARLHPEPVSTSLAVKACEVEQVLSKVNTRKVAGPDGTPGKVLKVSAHRFSEVFTMVFNLSLAQATIPACLISFIILAEPKRSAASQVHGFRPVTYYHKVCGAARPEAHQILPEERMSSFLS